MRRHLKKFFIPHAENNYHPHILHTKRAVFYCAVFLVVKIIVVLFALAVPARAYLLPDVLRDQYDKIITLTNGVRIDKNLPLLKVADKLNLSANAKALDMAQNEYFSHKGPGGRDLAYFLNKVDYKYSVAGENLAMGFSDAPSAVSAWMKSPTHYANLVDTDFQEIGVGLEIGKYRGDEVVYVAQHFGTLLKSQSTVSGQKVKRLPDESAVNNTIMIDRSDSHVYWIEQNGATILQARVKITGPVQTATVNVSNYSIELTKIDPNSDWYGGRLMVSEPADNFFKPIVNPAVSVIDKEGKTIAANITWFNIKVAAVTLVQKYLQARDLLSPITNVFSVSKIIYLTFIIFFGTALLINVLVEIKRQHYRIILQTVLLIGLLVGLWRV